MGKFAKKWKMEGKIIQNIIKIYQFLFHKQMEVTTIMDLKSIKMANYVLHVAVQTLKYCLGIPGSKAWSKYSSSKPSHFLC